ncbi:uncharacterized protein LOC123526132 [Mercenaria mercenaria]|uniref:uncharacterized protein LOC123526132 n=1 Tax=Mercenaria mercenaria TaxID=6596 RepID=UPI00234F2A84|nr:uncharacterized protein LOC123526132 [Mercenaria mercenaria]
MDTSHIIVLIVFITNFDRQMTFETCDNITPIHFWNKTCANYDVCYLRPSTTSFWFETHFWGGYLEIAWDNSSVSLCSKIYEYDFLVLTDKPPARKDLNDTMLSLEACIRNQNDICKEKVDVYMRNCSGNILLRFPWVGAEENRVYVCTDFVFSGGCNDSTLNFTSELVSENVIEISLSGTGWYNTFEVGSQYTYMFPSIENAQTIFDACPNVAIHFLLQDPVPETIEETPAKLILCRVTRVSQETDYVYKRDCNYFIYMRKCNGKLQFETTWATWAILTPWTPHPPWPYMKLCLVWLNSVKVIPEIRHTTQYVDSDGNTAVMYNPFLQFRCSFEMEEDTLYKIKWYINDTMYVETEPSNLSEDLALKSDDINNMELGYKIKCGVVKMTIENFSEVSSFNFFAGWKISDMDVKVTKGGSVTVTVEQTVPIGCAYTAGEQTHCSEELSIVDPSFMPDICKGSILAVNADDTSKTNHQVQTLKQGSEWQGNTKYRFKLSTSDVSYDDATVYDLQVRLTDGADNRARRDTESRTKVIDTLHVDVTDAWRHLNKLCYSHVDPHMRTADGRYYEQQREGDYMFLRNIAEQMEIQESARYCFPPRRSNHKPPVCTCGIAIRFGADVFMVNRCGSLNLLDFVQCGEGGILEVDRVHDYRYRVRAPTGTIIDITLRRSKFMNIDVYMSPRDFGNLDGLCGYFDGIVANDFLHRDGNISNGNADYRFSDSWRLSNEENLFKKLNRVLEPWNNKNDGRTCSRINSITKMKCKVRRRFKREDDVKRDFERLYPLMSTRESIRLKRNAQANMEVEVASFCNASIFGSPAVMEMQDKLADEDLSEVVSQCVYDVTEGNDTVWVEAHVQALSNIVTTVLELNPLYVANNTKVVETFLSQTCLNNCSGNGACSETGYCACNEPYRGPDCDIDLRIPPIIYDIEGGGICDVATVSDCECFVIRTDNIFDGFMCNITTYMVFFNGTRSEVGYSQQTGEYEDIFTGICCVSGEQTDLHEDSRDLFIVMYELSISNDGENYGETIPVYVYDTTCIQQVFRNENTDVEIKAGHCFIDKTCIQQGSTKQGVDQCSVCNPPLEPFRWYKGNCDADRTELTSATLIGIIIGSVLGFGIIVFGTCMLLCKMIKKYRAVHDAQSLIQTCPENINLHVREPNSKDAVSTIMDGVSDTVDVGAHSTVNLKDRNVVDENIFYTCNQPIFEGASAKSDGLFDAKKTESSQAECESGISSIF